MRTGKVGAVVLCVVMLGACTSAEPRASSQSSSQAPTAQPVAAPSAPKTLVVGQSFDMAGLNRVGRNDAEIGHVINAGLVTRDTEKFEVRPWMAEELPSLDKGTWTVSPDGRMSTTWKVKPNIKWHDGTAFSTKDFIFGWQLFTDPKFEADSHGFMELMEQLEAPDDRTLVVHWKSRLYLGNQLFLTYLMPIPSHLLGDLYQARDYDALNNHPYWNSAIVHLGPYRVTDFQRSSQVELQAFDQYFLGRPKIDRIIWKIISDSNTILANVLSNEVDVTTRNALNLDTAPIAESQWAANGQGTVKYAPTSWTWLNPGAANPIFGWEAPNQNLARQAIYHAINRQEISDTLARGREAAIDFPLSPTRPQFRTADTAVKKYPFDARRAEQLLNQAGWRRGGDGVMVNDRGERFSVEFRAATRADLQQLQSSIADYLKQVGIETQQLNMPDRQLSAPENRNRWPGLYIASHNIQVEDWEDRFHSNNVPTEATNWIGNNVAGWRNPRKDQVIDDLFDELQPQRQDQLIVDYLKLFTEDLPHLPIKYNAEVTTYRSNVKNVPVRYESGGENARTWNIHEWTKD